MAPGHVVGLVTEAWNMEGGACAAGLWEGEEDGTGV